MLQVRDLAVEVGGRLTLEEGSFTVAAGDKVGLVGRNGAGKTTMLGVLAGHSPAHSGQVVRRGALGYLSQDPRTLLNAAGDGLSALDHILSGRGLDQLAITIEKRRLVLEEDPSARNVERHAKAVEAFELAGGWAADAEIRRIAAGLGLSDDRLDLAVRVLSGGERRRVELARILFAGSELLLLDEPTNHLDTDAKAWLVGFLASYRGALLVVSHDLGLLDESITRVLHLDDARIIEYRGTYSQYRRAREADQARQTKVAAGQAKEIKRLSTLADSMRGQTQRRARTAKSIDHRVARLESSAITGPKKDQTLSVRLPDPPRAGRMVLGTTELTKSYGGPPVFSDVSFDLGRGERLMIMGLNGAGKTSLLRILARETTADSGTFELGFGVSAGYYAQEHEGIVAGKDLLSHVREQADIPIGEIRALLAMFGLPGDMAFQDASTLSGGEKTKLALAQLTAGRHNLLLLDEPTNNLDPPSRTSVAAALAGWGGAMVIVSHDPDFVRALAPQRVLLMPEGTLDHWSDDLLDLVAMA